MRMVIGMLAVAVALSARDLPCQGVQRWRRRKLAKAIAGEAGIPRWDMHPVIGWSQLP